MKSETAAAAIQYALELSLIQSKYRTVDKKRRVKKREEEKRRKERLTRLLVTLNEEELKGKEWTVDISQKRIAYR